MVQTMMETETLAPLPINQELEPIYKLVDKCLVLEFTRKYPLRGYILGVLTHTTAWNRHWRGDITLE